MSPPCHKLFSCNSSWSYAISTSCLICFENIIIATPYRQGVLRHTYIKDNPENPWHVHPTCSKPYYAAILMLTSCTFGVSRILGLPCNVFNEYTTCIDHFKLKSKPSRGHNNAFMLTHPAMSTSKRLESQHREAANPVEVRPFRCTISHPFHYS